MSTGATDMAQLRAKGVQCFGIGSATDFEDPPKGFGAHSDQERLLESELHRFVRFNWDVVSNLAGASEGVRDCGLGIGLVAVLAVSRSHRCSRSRRRSRTGRSSKTR